jgi:hypothetical protein
MAADPSKSSNASSPRPAEKKGEDVTVPLKRPSPAATAGSAFFRVLPPELRRAILIRAFGDRTLHVQPAACVCRRRSSAYRNAWGEYSPGTDCCTREYARCFQQKTGKKQKEPWMIGVMGWLRCCRQA